jgi:hypothetical protein
MLLGGAKGLIGTLSAAGAAGQGVEYLQRLATMLGFGS